MTAWTGPGGNYTQIGANEPAELDGTYITEQRLEGQKLTTTRRWFRAAPDLPKEPGFYLVDDPQYGEGPVVIELLADAKRWIDCSDRTYLTIDQVEDLAPLSLLDTDRGWRQRNGLD